MWWIKIMNSLRLCVVFLALVSTQNSRTPTNTNTKTGHSTLRFTLLVQCTRVLLNNECDIIQRDLFCDKNPHCSTQVLCYPYYLGIRSTCSLFGLLILGVSSHNKLNTHLQHDIISYLILSYLKRGYSHVYFDYKSKQLYKSPPHGNT